LPNSGDDAVQLKLTNDLTIACDAVVAASAP
jgi:hypothetical protein